MESFKWIWKHIEEYKYWIILGFFLVLVLCGLTIVNPYIAGTIVDRVIRGGETELLPKLIAMMIGLTIVKSAVGFSRQLLFETVSQNTIFKLRMQIYQKLQKLEFEFFDKNRTGDIMARMTGDMEAVRHFVAAVIYSSFEKVVLFLFALTMLFRVNAVLALCLLTISPLIGFLTFKLSRDVKPMFFAIREQFSRLNSVVQENISGNRVVKAFTQESYEIEKFNRENDAFRDKNLEPVKVWEKYLPVLDSLAGSLSVIIILVGGIMVIRGNMTLGELVMFNGYAWALNDPMRMAGWLVNDAQRFAASSIKIMSLMNTEPKIFNTENPKTDPIKGMVDFRNVSFSYGDEKVLENISFTAKPGQTVAIVGPTGSGKTSLVNLISRFYDCTEGEVLIDGVNIKEHELVNLRRNVSVAMQDIFLFSDTIEGNIAYGVPDATLEQVQWAAKMASAHDFIVKMPEGYDTIIGERGVGLSGGQKQRVALARAILKDPSILILDDTTSSVDMETEHEIQKALKALYTDKTTFIIAHRISSVKNADLILVLQDGRVIERGTHKELIDKKGYYYHVYMHQYGDFDDMASVKEVV